MLVRTTTRRTTPMRRAAASSRADSRTVGGRKKGAASRTGSITASGGSLRAVPVCGGCSCLGCLTRFSAVRVASTTRRRTTSSRAATTTRTQTIGKWVGRGGKLGCARKEGEHPPSFLVQFNLTHLPTRFPTAGEVRGDDGGAGHRRAGGGQLAQGCPAGQLGETNKERR